MAHLWTWKEIGEELGQVFTPEQAASLEKALDRAQQMERERAADTYDLKQELATLAREMGKLAAAQARTEARFEELAAAQARTEAQFKELAAAQARTEARVGELATAQARTEERVEELATAQARTEERLQRLEAAVQRLMEAQERTEERLQRLEAAVEQLVKAQARTEIYVADLRGWRMEARYRERAMAYFGRLLRRVRVLSLQDLEETLESRLTD